MGSLDISGRFGETKACFYQELRIISRHVCGDKKQIFLMGTQYVGSCICGNETGCF